MDVPLVINAPAPMAVLALFPWAANPLVRFVPRGQASLSPLFFFVALRLGHQGPVNRSIMECLYQCGLPPFDPELPAVNLTVLSTIAACAPALKTR